MMILIAVGSLALMAYVWASFRRLQAAYGVTQIEWDNPSQWSNEMSSGWHRLAHPTTNESQRIAQQRTRIALVGWVIWLFLTGAFAPAVDTLIRDAYPTPLSVGVEGAIGMAAVWALMEAEAVLTHGTRRQRLVPVLGLLGTLATMLVLLLAR